MRNVRKQRRGQGTVEFALMLPLVLALLFAVIEYAYYLGSIHYVNYGTYMAARALQAGDEDDPEETRDALMTGNVTSDVTMSPVSGTEGNVGYESRLPWDAQTPGFKQVMGNMDVRMRVYLGQRECNYEGKSVSDVADERGGESASEYSDNLLECG